MIARYFARSPTSMRRATKLTASSQHRPRGGSAPPLDPPSAPCGSWRSCPPPFAGGVHVPRQTRGGRAARDLRGEVYGSVHPAQGRAVWLLEPVPLQPHVELRPREA